MEPTTIDTDVLVIGGGVSGLAAAIAAAEQGNAVLLASKGPIAGRSASYYAAGMFHLRLPGPGPEGLEQWLRGSPLTHIPTARTLAEEAVPQIRKLISYGVPLRNLPDGSYQVDNSHSGLPAGGATMIARMAGVARRAGVQMMPGFSATKLLTEDSRCLGAVGVGDDGKPVVVSAKAVVLATGGAGRTFQRSSHPQGITGDGYALLLDAGAELVNLEFIRFFPLGLPDTPFPAHRPSRRFYDVEGLRVVNNRGEDVFQKHLGQTVKEAMEETYPRFVTMSRVVAQEQREGEVFLDLRQIPAGEWSRICAMGTRELIRQWDGSPGIWERLRKERLLPTSPQVQAFRGGVRVRPDMATCVEGLYAGGELVDSFSDIAAQPPCEIGPLACALVCGAVAGRSAGALANRARRTDLHPLHYADAVADLRSRVDRPGSVEPSALAREVGEIMTRHCGPLRSGPSMREGLRRIEEVESKIPELRAQGSRQLLEAQEVRNMARVAKAVLLAANLREESRSEHYREDFPSQDPARWERHIVVSLASERVVANTRIP